MVEGFETSVCGSVVEFPLAIADAARGEDVVKFIGVDFVVVSISAVMEIVEFLWSTTFCSVEFS